MTKTKAIQKIIECAENKLPCSVEYRYSDGFCCDYPQKCGKKLFLAVQDDDFQRNGVIVRRFADVSDVRDDRNKVFDEICRMTGFFDGFVCPDIDISDWHSVFTSLEKIGKNIIVESDTDDEMAFAIGKIVKVMKNKVIFHHFDADGVWLDEFWELLYSHITTVQADVRYVNVFSEYIERKKWNEE